jgi:hypothetical protein
MQSSASQRFAGCRRKRWGRIGINRAGNARKRSENELTKREIQEADKLTFILVKSMNAPGGCLFFDTFTFWGGHP